MKRPDTDTVTTIAEVIAVLLIVAGVACYSIPIALITAGVLLLVGSLLLTRSEARR